MKCPRCNYEDSKVLDSREATDGIRRRRECLRCGGRFTTYEKIQLSTLYIIKKDKRREPFQKAKVLGGVRKACEKRPIAGAAIEALANEIEMELYGLGKPEIASTVIGDMVMAKLRKLDHIAYIRFASVYRDFTDITRLKQEVDNLVVNNESLPLSAQLPLIPEVVSSTPVKFGRGGKR